MDHNIFVIDIVNAQVLSVKPSSQELQALIDTEDYIIIDPLNHTMIKDDGEFGAIETGRVHQDGAIIQVR